MLQFTHLLELEVNTNNCKIFFYNYYNFCVLMIYCVLNNITFKIFFKRSHNDSQMNG